MTHNLLQNKRFYVRNRNFIIMILCTYMGHDEKELGYFEDDDMLLTEDDELLFDDEDDELLFNDEEMTEDELDVPYRDEDY